MESINNEFLVNLLEQASFLCGLTKAAYEKVSPITAMLELTPRCNFHCKMCYVHLGNEEISQFGRELTAREWIYIAEQARDMGVLNLGLTGGEPMLREDFGEIYEALAQMGFLITIQTNCSLMDEQAMALFDRYPPYEIKTTLYGASDATYEKVCGIKGGLTRALDGIKKVQQADIPLTVVATAVKDNWRDMEDVYQLAAGLGIRLAHTNRILPHTRKPESGSIDTAVRFSDLSEQERTAIPGKRGLKFTSPLQRCKVYRTGFWVLWDGRLSLCAHMLNPSYSLLEMDMQSAWEKLIAELARLYPEQACEDCAMNDACMQCPATVQAQEPFAYSHTCEVLTKERRMLIDGGDAGLPCD